MTKAQKLDYLNNRKPIASLPITNKCSMLIYEINDEEVVVKGFIRDIHKYKLHYNSKGAYFEYCNGCRYFIRDFMRLN